MGSAQLRGISCNEDHGSVPIDINADDNACVQATLLGLNKDTTIVSKSIYIRCFLHSSLCCRLRYTGLMALRHPDAIQAVEVDGKTYVITANEGDDKALEVYPMPFC